MYLYEYFHKMLYPWFNNFIIRLKIYYSFAVPDFYLNQMFLNLFGSSYKLEPAMFSSYF